MRRWALPVLVLALVAGCTGGPAAPDVAAGDLAVELTQARTDYAARVVTLVVRNHSAETLVVTDTRLAVSGFEAGSAKKGRLAPVLRPGGVRRIGVVLGEARCADGDGAAELAGSDAPRHEVSATFTVTAEGGSGPTAQLGATVDDPQNRLAQVHIDDCAAAAVASGLRVRAGDRLETGTGGTAVVRLLTEPVPGGPRVRLDEVSGTTLIARGDGAADTDWSGQALAGQDSGEVDLRIRPARCDAHAVAEDKRGTFLPVHASVDGVPQAPVAVELPPPAKKDLLDFIAEACGW